MDNQLLKTIPLELAMEYYSDGNQRGRMAGRLLERKRILDLLKAKGLYEAILVIKQADEQTS